MGEMLYGLFNNVAAVVLAIYNLCMFREKRNNLSYPSRYLREKVYPNSKSKVLQFFHKKEIELFLEIIILSVVQYLPGTYLNPWYGEVGGTGANYFGLAIFSPFIFVAFCVLVRIDPLEQLDLITPAYPLALISAKIGCIFGKCCLGIGWTYNMFGETIYGTFPIQILEAIIAFFIFLFLRSYRKKAKKGTLYPIYLIAYSGTRFFSEFLRGEANEFGIFKMYHLHCAIGICVGLFGLWLVWIAKVGMEYSVAQKKKKARKHKRR